MGEVIANIELQNNYDRHNAKIGLISNDEVKKYSVNGLVDTGAVMLMLPEDIVKFLGLDITGSVFVRYADERQEERDIAGSIWLKIQGREMMTDCIVGPPNAEPLIGQIILERLDFLVNPQMQKLIPRPESPLYPLVKMK